jgi:hypothetical protein
MVWRPVVCAIVTAAQLAIGPCGVRQFFTRCRGRAPSLEPSGFTPMRSIAAGRRYQVETGPASSGTSWSPALILLRMRHELIDPPSYVIKALELPALNFLSPDHPRPQRLVWIDRGKNCRLQRNTIEMLIRTLLHDNITGNTLRLHQRAGLRVVFRCEDDRKEFAAMFKRALHAWNCGHQAATVSPDNAPSWATARDLLLGSREGA